MGSDAPEATSFTTRRRIAGIVLHVPRRSVCRLKPPPCLSFRGTPCAPDSRARTLSTPESLPWPRWHTAPPRSPRLPIRSCAAPRVATRRRLLHGPREPAQQIHLMNRLVHQRSAALGLPTALDGPRIISAERTTSHSSRTAAVCPAARQPALWRETGWRRRSGAGSPRPAGFRRAPAVSTIRRAVSRLVEMGFCTCTCLPVWAQISMGCKRKSGRCRHPRNPRADGGRLPHRWHEFRAPLVRKQRPYFFADVGADRFELESDLAYACACLWAIGPVADNSNFHRVSILANDPAYNGKSTHAALLCNVRGDCRLLIALASCKHAPPAGSRRRGQWPPDHLRQAGKDLPHAIPAGSRERQRRSGAVAETGIAGQF